MVESMEDEDRNMESHKVWPLRVGVRGRRCDFQVVDAWDQKLTVCLI